MLIPPDGEMFLSMTKAALALPILAVTSRFVPLLITVPYFMPVSSFPFTFFQCHL